MSDNAIIVENVTKRFDSVTAVDNLSLEIKWGELFGLLGPNGAGKTTLLNVLATLLEPTEGGAQVGGFDVEHDGKNVRDIIGVCPQEPAYYGHLTGRENIEIFGTFHDVPKEDLKERTDELIKKIGMEDHADRKAKEYSGGMVRRVSTVMALIHNPKVALLDEPTVAMDPVSRRAVWDFILELKEKGMAIVLTTHYMEEAEFLCDRVGIIDEGRLIAIGSPKDLMEEHNAKDLEEVFIKLTGKKLKEVV
ncbi:MAG: ABC transporter ATP-binding protein [Candidatus Thorarchaeota archaeon]|nr:ABC transporter ATP-binding protein [Candidatus Thorarchaeota archaeon]MCK5239961.1 ABC transporter ATP-binding protein [Candidatus Thorarchaeota archaeon]